MLKHFETAPSATISAVDENLILAEIEGLLSENLANNVQKDGDAAMPSGDRRRTWSFPLAVACGIAVVVALVPAGLKRADSAGKAAHQAMGDAARGSISD